jgi:hypothetical protein
MSPARKDQGRLQLLAHLRIVLGDCSVEPGQLSIAHADPPCDGSIALIGCVNAGGNNRFHPHIDLCRNNTWFLLFGDERFEAGAMFSTYCGR